jgi:tetratricopeptide (TPR) repeat protein
MLISLIKRGFIPRFCIYIGTDCEACFLFNIFSCERFILKTQDQILEELKVKIDSIPDKKEKIEEIIFFVLIYGDSFGERNVPLLEQGIQLSKEINFECGEVLCQYNLMFFGGMTQGHFNSKYNRTLPELVQMLDKLKPEPSYYAVGLNLIAFFHWFRGEYEKGFDLIFEATKLSGGNDRYSLAWNYFALGVFYFDTKDYDNSRISYQKAYQMFLDDGSEYGQARSMNGVASAAIMQNKTEEALPLLEFAVNTYRKLSHHSGLSRAVNDMGQLEKTNKNYPRAIKLFEESIELRKGLNHLQGLITNYTELGEVYHLIGNYDLALEQFKKGLILAHEVKTKQKQMRLHKLFYDTYKELKNTDLALENLERFYELKSELLSDEAANNIKKIQTKNEKEKSEKEAEIERLKNVELKTAYIEIEEKNKEILDSIRYAKRIQESLLPTDKYIEKNLERLKKKK